MVAQANNTETSKNTTNEKEKNNDSSTLCTQNKALNSQYCAVQSQKCQNEVDAPSPPLREHCQPGITRGFKNNGLKWQHSFKRDID